MGRRLDRHWRAPKQRSSVAVRDTDWVIATDGFMYSDRGLVMDSMEIALQPASTANTNVPFAKLDSRAFGWLGEISCGMTRTDVLAVLRRHSLKFQSQTNEVVLEAGGFSPITSGANADLRHWPAWLGLKNHKLSDLQLDAN